MFQGGELDLQSGCDGFDSRPIHDRSVSTEFVLTSRLQRQQRGLGNVVRYYKPLLADQMSLV